MPPPPPPWWLRLLSVLRWWFCCCWLFVYCYSHCGSVGVCHCSMFCCTLLYVHSSFAIILNVKRELVALPSLSSWCLVMVVWLFLAVPWVCLRFVIVVFPDHTRLLFFTIKGGQGKPCICLNSFINSFCATGKFNLLLITFANSLDPDQDWQKVSPDLDPNCLTLW